MFIFTSVNSQSRNPPSPPGKGQHQDKKLFLSSKYQREKNKEKAQLTN